MMAMTVGEHGRFPELSERELAELNARFERAPASSVIEWAVEQFHPYLCLTASMTDALVVDLAVRVEPSIEVVFIDTGYHFAETLETLDVVRRRYGLNLRVMTVPTPPVELWSAGPERCCSEAKVAELDRALVGKSGEGKPHRGVERRGCRRLHRRPRRTGQPTPRSGFPVHRMPAVYAGRGGGRGPALGPVAGPGED